MRIREVKDETIVVGPTEPPEVEKMPSLGSEEEEGAKKVVANGVAVLNGGGRGAGEEHDRLHRIGDGGEVRKTSAASSAGGAQGGSLIWLSKVNLTADVVFTQPNLENTGYRGWPWCYSAD